MNEPSVKFSWGVFCRRAITDTDTSEVSAIDIVTGLQIKPIFDKSMFVSESSQPVRASVGSMYVVALFERIDNVPENLEINETLDFEFLQVDLNIPLYGQIEIKLNPFQSGMFSSIKLVDLSLAINEQTTDYSFAITYKIQDHQIGKLILPVKVQFS